MSTCFYNIMGIIPLKSMVKKCQFCTMPIEHSFLASQPLFGLVTHGVKCCVGKLVKDTFTIATSGSHAGLA